jgi:hypothetical protein
MALTSIVLEGERKKGKGGESESSAKQLFFRYFIKFSTN